MTSSRPRVLVVGAGVAGLGAAVWLARRGHAVTVREAAPSPGGLLQPVDFEGAGYDRGSHRIHGEALAFLRARLPVEGWVERPRRGVLVLGGRQARYPLSPFNFARALGPRTTLRMALGWVLRPRRWLRFRRWEEDRRADAADRDEGYEAFVVARVGRSAYESFYRPYVEKVWGVDPAELSASVARQRFSSSSPLSRLWSAPRAETFWYPPRGMGDLVDGLTKEASLLGVTIETDAAAVTSSLRGWPAVLHTGPLETVAYTDGLSRRGLYLLHLRFAGAPTDEVDTWYVPGEESFFGRVSRPAAFTGAPVDRGSTVLAVEIPEGRWGTGVDFLDPPTAIVRQLFDAGILRRATTLLSARQTFVAGVYPTYRRGWVASWREAMASVTSLGNVYMAGRQGLFLHCNIDHALASALAAARCLSEGVPPAKWAVEAAQWLDVRVRD
ncbi:MAG: UDP-galactopyranose mutase [Myxococcaceae bacterium]|nr:UDP-galactopyranose mutase [Myxococcaceae bacterium]